MSWSFIAEHPSSLLRQAAMPVVRKDVCKRQDWLGDLVKGNVMCVGYADGGVDSCYGDSGGPFVSKGSGVWSVYGVVSYGVQGDCAQPKKPGVYTRVADYLEWIQRSTNGEVTTL
ncbi:Transmembrane protease serine 3 [Lamellibrachia satsuma]|nr:Transmembrane protease serine 3 [Lamellibrachia satsuma]